MGLLQSFRRRQFAGCRNSATFNTLNLISHLKRNYRFDGVLKAYEEARAANLFINGVETVSGFVQSVDVMILRMSSYRASLTTLSVPH